jgi:hypothetical protein
VANDESFERCGRLRSIVVPWGVTLSGCALGCLLSIGTAGRSGADGIGGLVGDVGGAIGNATQAGGVLGVGSGPDTSSIVDSTNNTGSSVFGAVASTVSGVVQSVKTAAVPVVTAVSDNVPTPIPVGSVPGLGGLGTTTTSIPGVTGVVGAPSGLPLRAAGGRLPAPGSPSMSSQPGSASVFGAGVGPTGVPATSGTPESGTSRLPMIGPSRDESNFPGHVAISSGTVGHRRAVPQDPVPKPASPWRQMPFVTAVGAGDGVLALGHGGSSPTLPPKGLLGAFALGGMLLFINGRKVRLRFDARGPPPG